MKRLVLIVLILAASYFAYISNKNSSKAEKHVIAVINYSPAAQPAIDGLTEGLRSFGYYEGDNLQIIYNGPITDKTKLDAEAEALASVNPEIIYSMSTPATLAAKKVCLKYNIPLVFGPVSAPVQTGIVEDLHHKGVDITGVSFGPQEARRLEMLTKIKTDAKDILVPYTPQDKSPQVGIHNLKSFAKTLNLNLFTYKIDPHKDITKQLQDYEGPYDAIYVPTDSMMVSMNKEIADFAISRKKPFTCPNKEGVVAGALFSYGFSIEDLGRQASRIVNMIFNGTLARDIPIELADFKLSVNMKTAYLIGVTIPKYLVNSAIIVDRADVKQP